MIKQNVTLSMPASDPRLRKICGFPEEIAGKMKAYATTLLEKMKACNPKDENAVCELVSWAFYESTEIHPFPNGNGRTSTIFGVDCVLHAFGFPDILMRTPAQREDPNSSYSIAIREIDNSREPLTAHIKGQLKMARDKTLRVSERKMQLIRERVLLGLKLNFVLNNLAGNHVLNDETMAYCRSYVENDQRVAENRYINLFVTRPRNPEKYLQRLQEIANISSQTVAWKRNVKTGMKFWVTGLTEQQTNDVADRFNALAAEHKANIGKMDISSTQGIIIWTNPPYIELKALSKACRAGIDSELATERAIAAEFKK
jgi:Fic/DOC family